MNNLTKLEAMIYDNVASIEVRNVLLVALRKGDAATATIAAQQQQIESLREALAQVRKLVNPNRPGGVSRFELEAAAQLLAVTPQEQT